MSKHTPGPWLHGPEYDEVRGTDGRVVARCSGWHGTKRAEINARLVAAAPDLLAALRDCLAALECAHLNGLGEAQQARAAIAKAEGKP